MTHLQLLPSYGKEQYQQLNIRPGNKINYSLYYTNHNIHRYDGWKMNAFHLNYIFKCQLYVIFI